MMEDDSEESEEPVQVKKAPKNTSIEDIKLDKLRISKQKKPTSKPVDIDMDPRV